MKKLIPIFSLLIFSPCFALANCSEKVDALIEAGVPINLMNEMAEKLQKYHGRAEAGEKIGLIDYSQSSLEKRFFVIDLESMEVKAHRVSHAFKSMDPKHPDMAAKFGNETGSQLSSIGLFNLRPITSRRSGPVLVADGLEASNNQSAARGVLMFGDKGVRDSDKVESTARNWGFAVAIASFKDIKKALENSVLYAGLSAKSPSTKTASRELKKLLNCSDNASLRSRRRAPSSVEEDDASDDE